VVDTVSLEDPVSTAAPSTWTGDPLHPDADATATSTALVVKATNSAFITYPPITTVCNEHATKPTAPRCMIVRRSALTKLKALQKN
jgi:hypothetical protein